MFRTEISLTPDFRPLARTARVLTLGSCFADSMGVRLMTYKVPTLVNPFGTVFNPLSAMLLLRAAAGEPADWSQHLVEARGRWQSYDLHGSIGADSAEALLARIRELVQRTAEFVRTADVLVLTLGTAWVYRLHETGELVSNCHKMPAALFDKELLTVEELVGSVAETHALLRRLTPRLRLVLTVSPVRHLRDTLPLNSVSKSVLRLASHYLSELLPDVSYFPAYELLNDDLRDYRFYAADMLHPSAVAEEYIWERFARTYFDAEFGRFRQEWDGIQRALAHQPLHAGAPEHRHFLESTLDKLRRLAGQQVEVRAEIRDVERRLLALPPPARPAPAPEPADDGEERIDIGRPEILAAEPTDPLKLPEPRTEKAAFDEVADAVVSPNLEEGLRTGRNRGRGRPNRRNQPAEASQVTGVQSVSRNQTPSAATSVAVPQAEVASSAAQKTSYTDFLISSAPELIKTAPDANAAAAGDNAGAAGLPTVFTAADTAAGESAKKKKRRSRGGAKRTARKNAARLAAEQAPPAETDAPEQPTAPLPAEPVIELAPAPAAASVAEAPEPRQKRGAGPAAKKSKVIVKSAPVKRNSRRKAAPESKSSPDPAPITPVVEADEPENRVLAPPPAALPESFAAASSEAASNPASPPAPAKRASAPKVVKPKAAPAATSKRAGAAKAKPAASRAKKPLFVSPPAVPETDVATSAAARPPVEAAPPTAAATTTRRRGRPPGTRKARPDESEVS